MPARERDSFTSMERVNGSARRELCVDTTRTSGPVWQRGTMHNRVSGDEGHDEQDSEERRGRLHLDVLAVFSYARPRSCSFAVTAWLPRCAFLLPFQVCPSAALHFLPA